MSNNLELHVIGIDFNSAPAEIRARFHLTSSQIVAVYHHHLMADPVMILSTCNRTECYIMGCGSPEDPFAYVERIFGGPIDRRHFYHYAGAEAWLHLLEMAVGLKSMLIGETEILGQLQDAIQRSADYGGITREQQHALGRMVAVARRIRHRTRIGGFSSSLYTLVLRELKSVQPGLAGLKALILGNGVISQHLSQAFGNQGLSTTILARNGGTKRPARPRAVSYGVDTVFGYEHLPDLLREHTVIVTATAAPHYLLKVDHQDLLRGKILIDLSFPRNIDPVLGRDGACRLWDLEYFAAISAANRIHKAQAATAARFQCLAALELITTKACRGSETKISAG